MGSVFKTIQKSYVNT